MPETDKNNAPKAEETAAKAQAESAPKQGAHSSAAHGGAYTLVSELAAAGGGQEPPPDRLTPIFRKSEFSNPVNDAQKARALDALQRQYGNRYVQRVLSGGKSEPPGEDASALVQRQASGASEGQEAAPHIDQSAGRPLDSDTRDTLGARFGQDFGGVRVHDDGAAHRAAKSLNAEAFTTGRDIYFSQGAYNPSSQTGQKLLAHELAHVAQQNKGAAGAAPQGFRVSHPSDPLERQADAASEAVMRGEMFPALTSSTAPVYQRQAGAGAASAAAPAPGGAGAGDAPAAAAEDFSVQIAGTTVVLPVKDLLKKAVPGNKLSLPDKYLKKVPSIPAFKLTEASLDLDDNKIPTGATLGLAVNMPPLEGTGSVSVDKSGSAKGSAHVVFSSSKIPGLKQTELDVTVTNKDFSFDASVDFELPKVTGNLKYKYQDHKHSGKGKAQYEGSKLKGGIEIIMSEAGLISGSGMLEMELFKGLKGEVEVAVDEKRNIGVKGKLSLPGQIELFPEKKYEKSFFNFEKKFPIWGITIPVIDVNVGIFAEIHAGAGFRAKFGPGVLRDIALTGEFGTDPEAATEFGLGGEFFVPAGAEVVANVGGGIGLGLAVADITGGIEAVGVAGLYTALTVRPQFKYAGGKYTISGMAELAGVAQLKFGINAFAKIDVGVWLFKGTVWRKDWTLAEWIWNTGLNVALRANISYTLGDDFAPDISFETGSVDPEKFIKDVMPESGSPVPAPPKPPVPDKGTLTAEGAQGQQAGGAPGEAPAPPTPGSPPAKTQQGAPGAAGAPPGAAGGAPGGAPGAAAPGTQKEESKIALPGGKLEKSAPMKNEGHTLTAMMKGDSLEIYMASGQQTRLFQLVDAARAEVRKRRSIAMMNLDFDLGQLRQDATETSILQEYRAAGAVDPRGGTQKIEFDRFMQIRLAQIASRVVEIGQKHNLQSLQAILGQTPPERYLPPGFRGSRWIRPNLYDLGSRWKPFRDPIVAAERKVIKQEVTNALAKLPDTTDFQAIIRAHRIPDEATVTTFTPTDVDTVEYDLDHIIPIAVHWNSTGLNDSDANRAAHAYNHPGNLRVVTSAWNRARGSGGESGEDRQNYFEYVKPNFTADLAENSKKDARTIGGQSFVDAAGAPLP